MCDWEFFDFEFEHESGCFEGVHVGCAGYDFSGHDFCDSGLFGVFALFQYSFEEVSFGYDSYDSVVAEHDEAADLMFVQKLDCFVD